MKLSDKPQTLLLSVRADFLSYPKYSSQGKGETRRQKDHSRSGLSLFSFFRLNGFSPSSGDPQKESGQLKVGHTEKLGSQASLRAGKL
jgi:hypothetical protein